MNEPVWLDKEIVLAIQSTLLTRFAGLEGVRDGGLLESALGRPQQLFNYQSPDLFDLAATYAHGIVKNYPFLDGNKRAGFMAASRERFPAGSLLRKKLSLQTLGLAGGEIGADDYAIWLRDSCVAS